LQDEILVKDILTAVTSSVDVPVTLKMRTGWSRTIHLLLSQQFEY
jgi:tRNA-dihydrouridine synthase B